MQPIYASPVLFAKRLRPFYGFRVSPSADAARLREVRRGSASCALARGHFSALVRTAAAGLGAAPAVVAVVFAAFLAAGIADRRAKAAHLARKTRSPAHKGDANFADAGAVDTEARAIGPRLIEAGIPAIMTFHRTLLAGLNAGSILFVMMRHVFLLRFGCFSW